MSQINVNTITGKDGGSAVNFPNGITVTGVITATQLNQNVTGDITASGTVTGGAFAGPLTGNVTGNASGTAGSTGVLSAGATGADLTLSGDLTVNGTTTTIDTAVTAVDSLAVDGNITSLGKIGIGTENPAQTLVVNSGGTANGVSLDTTYSGGPNIAFKVNGSIKSYIGAGGGFSQNGGGEDLALRATNNLLFDINGVEKFRIDQHGTNKFKGPLTEKANYGNITLNGDYNHDLITHGNVMWSDTAAAGAFTMNLRGSATVALNDMMSTGESLSFWFAHACHSTTSHYMTAFKVDGTTISGGNIIWAGGSAPTEAGGASGTKDVYTFTVFKTANATFRAFASVTNHA